MIVSAIVAMLANVIILFLLNKMGSANFTAYEKAVDIPNLIRIGNIIGITSIILSFFLIIESMVPWSYQEIILAILLLAIALMLPIIAILTVYTEIVRRNK